MRYVILFSSLFFASVRLYAQADVRSFTLAEAIKFAEENSLSVRTSQANITEADLRIKENRATGLPQVSASLQAQHFLQLPSSILPEAFAYAFIPKDSLGNPLREPTLDDRKVTFGVKNNITGTVSVSELIFSGSYTQAKRASVLYRDYVNQNLTATLYTVRNNVTDAYLPSLLIAESVKTFDRNIGNLERLLFETTEFNKAGFVEALDVDRLTLTLANLRTERDNLVRQKEVVMNALKFVMGYPMDQNITVSDNIAALLNTPADEALGGVVRTDARPELKVIDMGIKLNEVNQDIIRAGRLPTVAAFGNYQLGLQGDNLIKEGFFIPTALIGLTASVPIYDGGQRKYQLQRAQIATEIVRTQRTELERAISLQVQNARIAYRNAQFRVTAQQKNIELAERIQRVSQTKYREGIGSSIEVVQAEQSLYQTQQNLIQAQFDLLVAQKSLEKALGN